MSFVLYFERNKEKFYISELPKFTVMTSRTWRLLYKILKMNDNCQCSDQYRIGVLRGVNLELTAKEVFELINLEDRQEIAADLDPENFEVVEHHAQYMCVFCNYMPLWYHVHPVLRFLEILHKDIQWISLAENVHYSGWILIQDSPEGKLMILFEVNLAVCSLRFMTSRVYAAPTRRVRSLDSIRGGQEGGIQFKSAATLFMLSVHRPFPKLQHLALAAACHNHCQFHHLPPTLQNHLAELHMWLTFFQPKGGECQNSSLFLLNCSCTFGPMF